MRITPDTNVLIASLISRGFCHELLEHCFLNYTLITSEFILDEVKEKLVEKFNYSTETAEEAATLFRSRMQIVVPATLLSAVSRDADEDNILATAAPGDCDCIITGDKDLLILKQFEGINILNPREFSDQEKTD